MKHIETNLRIIRRRIMVRVWYSYILSLLSNPFALVGIVFGASVTLLMQLVSVVSILQNLLNVRLGLVPQYFWQTVVETVRNGELLKILAVTLIVVSLFYLRALVKHSPRTSPFFRSVKV